MKQKAQGVTLKVTKRKRHPSDMPKDHKRQKRKITSAKQRSKQPSYSTSIAEQTAFRTTTCKTLAILYTLVVTSSGVILSTSLRLCDDQTTIRTCHSVFHLFMFCGALVFLVFIYGWVLHHQQLPLVEHVDNVSDKPNFGGTGDIVFQGTIKDSAQKEVGKNQLSPSSGAPGSSAKKISLSRPRDMIHSSEGVHTYLRLGAVGFGMGSVILDAFRFVELWDNPDSICQGEVYFVNAALRCLFVLGETMFFFKNHKVVIRVYEQPVRLGLLHLLATNLCLWVDIVVQEAAESFSQHNSEPVSNQQLQATNTSNPSAVTNVTLPTPHIGVNSSAFALLGTEAEHKEDASNPSHCFSGYSLVSATAGYLYPWAIEHAFIAAAICYKIFTNVGTRGHQVAAHRQSTSGQRCHKANMGLFSGLVVLVAAIVCIVVILVLKERGHILSTTARILFCVSNTSIACFAMSGVIISFWKLRKLKFTPCHVHFELRLLYIAATAYFLHFGFTSLPVIMSLSDSKVSGSSMLHFLMITVSTIQAIMQTTFIADGYCRRARDHSHLMLKPGRAALLFTLLCNISLWLTSIFMFKHGHSSEVHIEYFGSFAWATILHVTLPIAIFFRFHSSVCLSDIWSHAYTMKTATVASQTTQIQVVPIQDMDDSSILF